jgi:hypothetical protein
MAYTRENAPAMPGPGDPGIISHPLTNIASGSSSPDSVVLKVPWNNVKLVYGYTAVTTLIDSNADMIITVTDGTTTLLSVTGAKSDAVGHITDCTVATSAAANLARRHLTNASTLTVSWYGGGSSSGEVMLHLYFEPDDS